MQFWGRSKVRRELQCLFSQAQGRIRGAKGAESLGCRRRTYTLWFLDMQIVVLRVCVWGGGGGGGEGGSYVLAC